MGKFKYYIVCAIPSGWAKFYVTRRTKLNTQKVLEELTDELREEFGYSNLMIVNIVRLKG